MGRVSRGRFGMIVTAAAHPNGWASEYFQKQIYSIMQNSPVATYFIGGAADKNRFWYVLPTTNWIRDELIKRYFYEIRNRPIAALEVNNHVEAAYYGYDEMEQLFVAIQKQCAQQPGTRIRLIGHSLGAWRAAKLSSQLAEKGIAVALLITIDPVGVGYFMRFAGSEPNTPAPKANLWINILAGHTVAYDEDDVVADAGVRWRPARDPALKAKPKYDYETPYSHAAVWPMMVFPGANGKSAWQLLLTES